MPPQRNRPSRTLYADRWAGILTDIADVARAAVSAFAQAGQMNPDFALDVHTWERGAERELTFASIEAFLEYAPSLDLSTITSITLSVWVRRGPLVLDDQHVNVTFGGLGSAVS